MFNKKNKILSLQADYTYKITKIKAACIRIQTKLKKSTKVNKIIHEITINQIICHNIQRQAVKTLLTVTN